MHVRSSSRIARYFIEPDGSSGGRTFRSSALAISRTLLYYATTTAPWHTIRLGARRALCHSLWSQPVPGIFQATSTLGRFSLTLHHTVFSVNRSAPPYVHIRSHADSCFACFAFLCHLEGCIPALRTGADASAPIQTARRLVVGQWSLHMNLVWLRFLDIHMYSHAVHAGLSVAVREGSASPSGSPAPFGGSQRPCTISRLSCPLGARWPERGSTPGDWFPRRKSSPPLGGREGLALMRK